MYEKERSLIKCVRLEPILSDSERNSALSLYASFKGHYKSQKDVSYLGRGETKYLKGLDTVESS